jgi:hypothetical protein
MDRFAVVVALLLVPGLAAGRAPLPPRPKPSGPPDLAEQLGRLPTELAKSKKTDAEVADAMFEAALKHRPTAEMRAKVVSDLQQKGADRALVCKDVMRALVNTPEFQSVNKLDQDPDRQKQFQDDFLKFLNMN